MIPQSIIQFWDADVPDDIKKLMDSWRAHNQEMSYQLFSRDMARDFISCHYGSEITALFDKAKIPAMMSDIFRVSYIYAKGGIYIDAATQAKQPITDIPLSPDTLTVMKKWHGRIWNGFIAAPKKDPVLGKIWLRILRNLGQQDSNDVWSVSGPGVFTEIVGSNLEVCNVIPQIELKPYFGLVNDLQHKGDDHWSKRQSFESIWASGESGKNVVSVQKNDYEDSKRQAVKKVVIHFGPHKTGTTSFQALLESCQDQLANHKVGLLTVRSKYSEQYKIWRVQYTKIVQGFLLGNIQEDVAREKITQLYRELELCVDMPSDTIVISDENLLGPIPGHPFAKNTGIDAGFYSAFPLVVDAIKDAYADKELHVIVVKRDFEGFLCSAYRDFILKLNAAEDLLDFRGKLSPDFKSQFTSFYTKIKKKLDSNADIYEFSIFVDSTEEIIEKLIGVSIPKLKNGVRNTSLSWRAAELALSVIPVLKNDEERRLVSRFLLHNIKGSSEYFEKQLAEINK